MYARNAEAEVHQQLASYRIRVDPEFFDLDYRDALRIIDAYLRETRREA
jgi:hypothetical protein